MFIYLALFLLLAVAAGVIFYYQEGFKLFDYKDLPFAGLDFMSFLPRYAFMGKPYLAQHKHNKIEEELHKQHAQWFAF